MSLWFIAAYVKNLRGFNSAEKAVLFVLAEYYNRQEKVAWPEQSTLAAAAGMSERTLIRVLHSLEAVRPGHPHGVLRRSRRHDGRGATTNYHFVEFERKDDKMGDAKGDNLSPVIRNNDQTIEQRTLPNPPLQGGNISPRPLTARESQRLNERIYTLQRSHLDQYGHQRYNGFDHPTPAFDFAEALEVACQQLMLPVESAWAAAEMAGLGGARRKEPQKVTA